MSIDQFADKFRGGMRPTLFRVDGNIPGQSTSSQDRTFFIKSSQFPASTVGVIEVPYKGRKIKRPGDRTFAEWTITVLADEKGHIRADFVTWLEKINSHKEITVSDNVNDIFAQWSITALGANDNPLDTITLVRAFPTEVGAMDFSYETTDTVAEFTVTLHYDYWLGGGAEGS
jgi:hypothetical protein